MTENELFGHVRSLLHAGEGLTLAEYRRMHAFEAGREYLTSWEARSGEIPVKLSLHDERRRLIWTRLNEVWISDHEWACHGATILRYLNGGTPASSPSFKSLSWGRGGEAWESPERSSYVILLILNVIRSEWMGLGREYEEEWEEWCAAVPETLPSASFYLKRFSDFHDPRLRLE